MRTHSSPNPVFLDAKEHPLPPDIAHLPTIVAEPWVKIEDPRPIPTLEGSQFDANGNLLVCYRERPWSQIIRITPDKDISVVYRNEDSVMIGTAVHRDGRIFACDLERGRIFVLSPEGELLRELLGEHPDVEIHPNDLDFDRNGNLYFSDFSGEYGESTGGIWRLDAQGDYTSLTKIAENLNRPNGIALSPEGDVLWTAETLRNNVLRIGLDTEGFRRDFFLGSFAVYQGMGYQMMDSTRCDSAGNVYQAVQYGGRCLILNREGIPIANVIVSDREKGDCMGTPNLALKPGTSEGYLLGCGARGSWVFKFPALAPAQKPFCIA